MMESMCTVSRSPVIARARNSNWIVLRFLRRRGYSLVPHVNRGVDRFSIKPEGALLWLAEQEGYQVADSLLHVRRSGDDEALVLHFGFQHGGLDVLQESGQRVGFLLGKLVGGAAQRDGLL